MRLNKYSNLKSFIAQTICILFFLNMLDYGSIRYRSVCQQQFDIAKEDYKKNSFSIALKRLERIIKEINIKIKKSNRKYNEYVLLRCKTFLLMGACYENLDKQDFAKKNYKKSHKIYRKLKKKKIRIKKNLVEHELLRNPIPDINFSHLPLYKKIFEKKKKFPIFLVISGILILGSIIYAILKHLEKKNESKKKDVGSLRIESTPDGANILIDDVYVGKLTNTVISDVEVGEHQIKLIKEGYYFYETSAIVIRDQETSVSASLIKFKEVNFVTDVESMIIPEGSTESFKIKLSTQPSSEFLATVKRKKGDNSISVKSQQELKFNRNNWNTYQTVTLEAKEDSDKLNGEAEIHIDASGIESKLIKVIERDNDSLNFILEKNEVSITEGESSSIGIRLSENPYSLVNASVKKVSGDASIAIKSGSYLAFSSSNWFINKYIVFKAKEDSDILEGEAIFQITASNIPPVEITVREQDNDSLKFNTSTDELSIPEGGTASFYISLSDKPNSVKHAVVSWISGDTDISVVSGSNPSFSPSNWTNKLVTLGANEDSDFSNGEAIIRILSDDIESKDIIVREVDNDSCNFLIEYGIDRFYVPEGGSDKFRVKLSIQPDSNVNATVERVSGDNDLSVMSGSSLTFNSSNWDDYQTVYIEAKEDPDDINGEAIIRISAQGIANKDLTAIEFDNDTQAPIFITNEDRFYILEGSTDDLQIKLSSDPSLSVSVSLRKLSGSQDLSVISGSPLTFNASDWNIFKTVVFGAAEDINIYNEHSYFIIEADGIESKEILVQSKDNDGGYLVLTNGFDYPIEADIDGDYWTAIPARTGCSDALIPGAHVVKVYIDADTQKTYDFTIIASENTRVYHNSWD